jgi:hypothetical protein
MGLDDGENRQQQMQPQVLRLRTHDETVSAFALDDTSLVDSECCSWVGLDVGVEVEGLDFVA